MAEYIERSDAAEYFEKSKQTMWHKDDIAATISSKANIPTADVVEIRDCEQCEFFSKPHDEYPCSHCKNCYVDKFKPKGGETE